MARSIISRSSNVYISERKIKPMALDTRDERGRDKEGRYFFFACPGLDIWSVGATRKEAEKKLREEMLMLLMRCSRYDELDYFLRESCFVTVEVRAS